MPMTIPLGDPKTRPGKIHVVPREEFDAMKAECDTLKAEVRTLRAEVRGLREDLRWARASMANRSSASTFGRRAM